MTPVAARNLCVKYICPICQTKYHEKPIWRVKCRAQECMRPASKTFDFKYCSDQHAKSFFSNSAQKVNGMPVGYLKSLMQKSASLQEFKDLINQNNDPEEPSIPQEPNDKVDENARVLRYIDLCVNRKQRLSQDRKRPVCGFDDRLVLNKDFVRQHADDAQLEDDDLVCMLDQSRCKRHYRWAVIFAQQLEYDSKLLQSLQKIHQRHVFERERGLKLAQKGSVLHPLLPAK